MVHVYDEYEDLVLTAILEGHGVSFEEALEIFENDAYLFHEVESFDELIYMFIDEGMFGEIPSNIVAYLDYDKIARDLRYDGYVLTSVGIINID